MLSSLFLTEITDRQAELAQVLQRSSVQINVPGQGRGSGVIWRSDGLIITNAHVVTGAGAIVQFADGRSLPAAVTARNRSRDLAALQIDATDLPSALIGDSDSVRVGELVLALGNPLEFTPSLTTGVIHAIGSSRSWLQADVTLAPGNSGGLLANAQGQVIGINTMIVEGRGFAIPSRAVEKFLHDRAEPQLLGVTIQPMRLQLQRRRSTLGLLITQIEAGSSAAAAGLQVGDVLVGVRGRLFQSVNDLSDGLEDSQAEDSVALDFIRDKQWMTTALWNWKPAEAA
jgi:serine protease Do